MNHLRVQCDHHGRAQRLILNGAPIEGRVEYSTVGNLYGRVQAIQLRMFECAWTVEPLPHPSPWPWLQQFKQQIGGAT